MNIEQAVYSCSKAYRDPERAVRNEKFNFKINSDSVEIAIAGSDDLKDWRQNFDLQQFLVGNHKFSSGTVNAADLILYDIDSDLQYYDYPIYIAGHSKGGGVAQVVAFQLHLWGFNVAQVYTFGAPRITRTKFEFPFPVLHVQAYGDPVPHLPCYFPWRTWRHNGQILRVGKNKRSRIRIKNHSIRHYQKIISGE